MTDTKMAIWDALKTPPGDATKAIQGGRLKGKTDINPQWRLEVMTRQFGPCGVGWRYVVEKLWTVPAGANGEVVAFADVNVYVKDGEEWSQPIPGIGGNMLIVKESSGLHINDECFKMAVTDALSVAFKALGVAADVYMGKFDSKYDQHGGKAGGGGGQRQKRQPRDEGLGNCPKCGTFLAKRERNDGSGSFLSCQGYPKCKYSGPLHKDEKPKAAPAAAPKAAAQTTALAAPRETRQAAQATPVSGLGPAQEPAVEDLPRHAALGEAEEMCPLCGNHPINPDGHCPNEHKAEDQPQAEQEWRPQCCGRSMMPRAGLGGEPPFWQCPRCKKKKDMPVEERKRVGL